MAFGGMFGGFRGMFDAGGVLPWWLQGGVSAANCIAAYQPKGAVNLAASYVNLANPGTYNAAPGTAPTWDVTTGWYSDGTKILVTGIAATASTTLIIRFSGFASSGASAIVCGQSTIGAANRIYPNRDGSTVGWRYGANTTNVSPQLTDGVLALAGSKGYRNGVLDYDPATTYGTPTANIAVMGAGTGACSSAHYVQAFAVYSVALSVAQVLAITLAMAAL